MESIPLHLLLAMGVVALIWAYVFFRRAGLVGGCLAAIGTGSCLGHPFFHVSVITIDRVLLAAVGCLYFGSRSLFGMRAKPMHRMDWVVVAFTAMLAVNVFTSDWRANGGAAVATLLFFYLMPFAFYWIPSRCEMSEQNFKWIIGFFAGLGAYLAIIACFEVLGISAAVFPRYIMSPEHEEFFGRARGPYLNPICNGMYLTAALIAVMLWWPYVKTAHRPLVVASGLLVCLGAGLTLTRSVWLGLAAVVAGMVWFIVPKQHRIRVTLGFALGGFIVLGVVGESLSQFKRDKHVSAQEMAESAKLRPILAAYAYEMFSDHPLTGVGLGQYSEHNLQYLTSRRFDLPLEKAKAYMQHNVFLSLLTETGLVGVTLFVLMIWTWGRAACQLWYTKEMPLWQRQCGLFFALLLAAYLANAMFHELSIIPMLNTLIFFGAGLVRSQDTVAMS